MMHMSVMQEIAGWTMDSNYIAWMRNGLHIFTNAYSCHGVYTLDCWVMQAARHVKKAAGQSLDIYTPDVYDH